MENMFSIGELSKYQNISKQTLIFYDKIGLFCPEYVDPQNGYRYYSAKQIDYLDTILFMKKIGFSLKEIQEHMKNYNIENSISVMTNQIGVIEKQVNELTHIKNKLTHKVSQLKAIDFSKKESVEIGETDEQYILMYPVESPYTPAKVSIATKKCLAEVFAKELPAYFQIGVSVPLKHIVSGDCTLATKAFVSTEKTNKSKNVYTLPKGKTVCAYHFGDYSTIGEAYDRILEYCRKNRFNIISDSYEFCINDYITTGNEKEFITKIIFYLE